MFTPRYQYLSTFSPNFGGDFDAYRFAFNGKEADNETYGDCNSYDFGARIYDARLGRWLSTDRFESKYPFLSPFSFAANNPISIVDIGGDSLYILIFTAGNCNRFDDGGDAMFYNAALTRKADIENSAGFDNKRDKVVMIEVVDMASIQKQVRNVIVDNTKVYGKTVEVGIWSHAGPEDGPMGGEETSNPEFKADQKQMSMTGWRRIYWNWAQSSGDRMTFYGCNTDEFAKRISTSPNMTNVSVSGFPNSAYPSTMSNSYETNDDFFNNDYSKSGKVYMVSKGKYIKELSKKVSLPATFQNGETK
jgi:RHS repeat-associated protein